MSETHGSKPPLDIEARQALLPDFDPDTCEQEGWVQFLGFSHAQRLREENDPEVHRDVVLRDIVTNTTIRRLPLRRAYFPLDHEKTLQLWYVHPDVIAQDAAWQQETETEKANLVKAVADLQEKGFAEINFPEDLAHESENQ